MRSIIVTGGLGFIGSNLINFLEKKKYFIINVDKVSYSSNFNNIIDEITSPSKYFKNQKTIFISIILLLDILFTT